MLIVVSIALTASAALRRVMLVELVIRVVAVVVRVGVGASAHHPQHRDAAGPHEPRDQHSAENEERDVEPRGVVQENDASTTVALRWLGINPRGEKTSSIT